MLPSYPLGFSSENTPSQSMRTSRPYMPFSVFPNSNCLVLTRYSSALQFKTKRERKRIDKKKHRKKCLPENNIKKTITVRLAGLPGFKKEGWSCPMLPSSLSPTKDAFDPSRDGPASDFWAFVRRAFFPGSGAVFQFRGGERCKGAEALSLDWRGG